MIGEKRHFLIFKFTKGSFQISLSHGGDGEEYQSIARILFIFLKELSLFSCKSSRLPHYYSETFLHVRNRKSPRKKNKQKLNTIFRSFFGNRLDNKSSSKCLDGSLKNFPSPFLPFMRIHRVENLFATRKFICVWISIVSSNAKSGFNGKKNCLRAICCCGVMGVVQRALCERALTEESCS